NTSSCVNQYPFEAGATLRVLALCAAAGRHPRLEASSRLAIIGLPAAAIGGVLALPGLALGLVLRELRRSPAGRRTRLLALALTFGMSTVVLGLSYVTMYSSGGARSQTRQFFADQQFTGGAAQVVPQMLRFVASAL